MSQIGHLHRAKTAKQDEYYTRLEDIEDELQHYEKQFNGKVVFCNCDTPESNFVRYFSDNARRLGIKGLLHMGFNPNAILDDGDFRKPASTALLKQADIVCTNPPFSLFIKYIDQLMQYNKKFLVIGPFHAVTYCTIFTYIRKDKMRIGLNKVTRFIKPDGSNVSSNCIWYTNYATKPIGLTLTRSYNPSVHLKYANYDAINVDNLIDIPDKYYDKIGVPVTYTFVHDPEQFDIIGLGRTHEGLRIGVKPYNRAHRIPGLRDGDIYLRIDGKTVKPFTRILIQRRQIPNREYRYSP